MTERLKVSMSHAALAAALWIEMVEGARAAAPEGEEADSPNLVDRMNELVGVHAGAVRELAIAFVASELAHAEGPTLRDGRFKWGTGGFVVGFQQGVLAERQRAMDAQPNREDEEG